MNPQEPPIFMQNLVHSMKLGTYLNLRYDIVKEPRPKLQGILLLEKFTVVPKIDTPDIAQNMDRFYEPPSTGKGMRDSDMNVEITTVDVEASTYTTIRF